MSQAPPIVLRGVRVHNLRDVDVRFPAGRITVVSGVSGSGKSSLAFDALYAEGRRRYVECLSTYTRQFLDRADRPDLDAVQHLPPAIAVHRSVPAAQARSTVGSVTEVHDYLRLLFARIGTPSCPSCGRDVEAESVDAVAERLAAVGGRGVVAFEVRPGAAPWDEVRAGLVKQGFTRAWRAGGAVAIDEARPGPGEALPVVVDRVELRPERRSRLAEAVETAYRFGGDRGLALREDAPPLRFSRRLHCAACDREVRAPHPALFSPSSPLGACPACQGFGRSIGPDLAKVVPDPGRTLAQGAVDPWTKPAYAGWTQDLRRIGRRVGLPWDRPYRDLVPEHRRLIEEGGLGFPGIRGFFRWLETKTYKVHVRVFLARYRAYVPCAACGGRRLRPEALAVRIGGRDLAEIVAAPLSDAAAWVDALAPAGSRGVVAAPVLAELRRRLRLLVEVGLGYLTLDRPSRTLSGGEYQRNLLARCLGSGLVGTLYVLDEPSLGLHPADVERLLGILGRLRDLGNTVVLVEHDPRVIRAADWLVDLGPGAGAEGGRIVYEGPPAGVVEVPASLTGAYLSGRRRVSPEGGGASVGADGWIELEGATLHNLRDLTVRFPRRALTAVAGPSGSGKSSLVHDTLYPALTRALGAAGAGPGPFRALRGTEGLAGVERVDPSPPARTPRSNPATYVGAFDAIRRALAATPVARACGLAPGFFSFNRPGGRCEACQGAGAVTVEMHFLPDLLVPCEACGGRRFGPEALDVRLRGRSVADILEMTVAEAAAFFADGEKSLRDRLALLRDTGLGYLRLGQPAPTLSGGEAQRLKLAAHLLESGGSRVFLLDEPTRGLHLHDLAVLLRLLRRLVASGHTLVVVEHHAELLAAADWVVELGPGAGPEGGRLVREGPPSGWIAQGQSEVGWRCAPPVA